MKKEGGVGGGQVERPWLPKLGFCRSSTLGWRETEKLGEAEENGVRLCSGKRGRSKTARNGGHRITPNVGRAPSSTTADFWFLSFLPGLHNRYCFFKYSSRFCFVRK